MAACRGPVGYHHRPAPRPNRTGWHWQAPRPVRPATMATPPRAARHRRWKGWWCSPAHCAAAPREQFEAAAGGREHLAWITQSARIECLFNPQHLRDVVLAEDQRHQVFLFHTDAVLTTQRAAS